METNVLKNTFDQQQYDEIKEKINNLYLEVFVDVEVKERISLPRSSKDVTIHIEAPLSIKIISGSVPDYYGGIVGKNSETVFLEEKD